MTESVTDAKAAGATPYRVLARKYRPQNFDDLIGQEAMVRTLTNAFRTGRIAQAYMLTGVRGVGKTTTARILARALNYARDGINQPTIDLSQPGDHCRAIMEGRHVDVIEMDAASHTGIDDIRDIIESVQYAPAIARYKVYIIDEVHMLSRNAFNGLLKTLEEPPSHLKFIFATTEIRKVPVTVLSRCQRFDLRRIDAPVLATHLRKVLEAEKVEAQDEALALIARAAEGSVRDALSILDQAIAHAAGTVEAEEVRGMLGLADRTRVISLFDHVMKGEVASALAELRHQYDHGADPSVVMTDLADFVHFVTRLKYVPAVADDVSLSQAERERGAEFASSLSVRVLGRTWQILLKGLSEIAASERPLAAADMVLVRLAHASSLPAPDELVRQITGTAQTGTPAGQSISPSGSSPVRTSSEAVSQTRQPAANSSGQVLSMAARQPAHMPARQPDRAAEEAAVATLKPAESPEPVEAPQISLGRFEDMIILAEDKRDIQLRTLLRRNVKLVSFSDGRMEINLAGNPPASFIPDLSSKLQLWTGKRWIVTTSRDGGGPTIEEAEKTEAGRRTDMAMADPDVAAIIARFPGSKVIDVRLRAAEPGVEASESGSEPLPEPPADDFND